MWPRVALVLALAACGCAADRTLPCTSRDACVRDGVQGECVVPGFCAFPDSSCDYLDLRWDSTAGSGFSGDCVEEDTQYQNECGGRFVAPGAVGDPCGQCGSFACGDADFECQGELTDPIALQSFEASTTSVKDNDFDTFGPSKVIDGDPATSWMSGGPGSGSDPTAQLNWFPDIGEETTVCIGDVQITGNDQHPLLSQNCGFERVTFFVVDESEVVVGEQSVELPGTPDPSVTATLNRQGSKVVLEFRGFESDDCGGFAEITATGWQ